MNKRIRELEQQALSIVLNGNDPDSDVDKMYIPSEFTKKFAELIVRECAGLLEKEAESSHDEGTDTYNILLKESNWMKRYFGVEE